MADHILWYANILTIIHILSVHVLHVCIQTYTQRQKQKTHKKWKTVKYSQWTVTSSTIRTSIDNNFKNKAMSQL